MVSHRTLSVALRGIMVSSSLPGPTSRPMSGGTNQSNGDPRRHPRRQGAEPAPRRPGHRSGPVSAGSPAEGRGKAAFLASVRSSSVERTETHHDRNSPATPAQRRRRPHVVRHPRRGEGSARDRPIPVPGAERLGSAAPTAGRPSRASSGQARRTRRARSRLRTTRTTRPSWSGRTGARPRRSSSSTPLPPASPRAWRTSPPPAGSPCAGSRRPSRATSI